MLKMTNADDLMLCLGDFVPEEPAVGIIEVERVECVIYHLHANTPICQYFCFRVWLTGLRWPVRQFPQVGELWRR